MNDREMNTVAIRSETSVLVKMEAAVNGAIGQRVERAKLLLSKTSLAKLAPRLRRLHDIALQVGFSI
jgi:hypothetical protein